MFGGQVPSNAYPKWHKLRAKISHETRTKEVAIDKWLVTDFHGALGFHQHYHCIVLYVY